MPEPAADDAAGQDPQGKEWSHDHHAAAQPLATEGLPAGVAIAGEGPPYPDGHPPTNLCPGGGELARPDAPAPREGPSQAAPAAAASQPSPPRSSWTGARQRPPGALDRCPWNDCAGHVRDWVPCADRPGWETGRCTLDGSRHTAWRPVASAAAGGGSG
jgi:hypothetical protein